MSGTGKIRFGLWYDFRNPAQWRRPYADLYAEILDQIVWAEDHGFDDVWLSEHHFIDDGYLPSMLPAAAAIAARTKRIRIPLGVLLMPFHNPVRLAEDIAVVDVISRGRFELGVGVGYKVEEFEGFNVAFGERGGRTNEALQIIDRLLRGETVTFKGKYFEINRARVTPDAVQQPRPPIWVGGFTPPALRRAAKYADGFTAPDASRKVYDAYLAELVRQGKPADPVRFAAGHRWLICASDPDKTFNEAADHIIYQSNNYTEWAAKAGQNRNPIYIRDRAHLRETGGLIVVDPAACVRMIKDYVARVPMTHYYSWTLPPGLPPRWAREHLELFASKVIPEFA
ncbi:MAG TPA: LLM class flavin-dependent oxidoreductase [Candidatus Binataceae bacterium]|nr:LLM class flavin-dependent oxidoreductase [Candidatus Binataceae bacterium]